MPLEDKDRVRHLLARIRLRLALVVATLGAAHVVAPAEPPAAIDAPPRLELETIHDLDSGTDYRTGTFRVPENRDDPGSRTLELDLVVLPAVGDDPQPDPVFILAGGPGQNAASLWRGFTNSMFREHRDVVLLSQRGTGRRNRLNIKTPGGRENVAGYLEPLFQPDVFAVGLEALKQEWDLTQYSTFHAADDLNDLREQLGYEKINLSGGSYGTRMALIYLRQYPDSVRTAILNGVAPVAFKNPLYHAQQWQQALEKIFAMCAADPDCHAAYPDLKGMLDAVMARFDDGPIETVVTHPTLNRDVPVTLTREGFAGALRVVMYYGNADVPYMIQRAFDGDFRPFAERALTQSAGIREALAMGMLMCVTCAEDVDRITEEEIERITGGTYLGDGRVRAQKAVCDFWPRSAGLPDDFGADVVSDVPVLLLSGDLDPVTGPGFGEEAASHLSNSLHVVAPGAHGVGGPCIRSIIEQFLENGTAADIDTSCIEQMTHAPFTLPD